MSDWAWAASLKRRPRALTSSSPTSPSQASGAVLRSWPLPSVVPWLSPAAWRPPSPRWALRACGERWPRLRLLSRCPADPRVTSGDGPREEGNEEDGVGTGGANPPCSEVIRRTAGGAACSWRPARRCPRCPSAHALDRPWTRAVHRNPWTWEAGSVRARGPVPSVKPEVAGSSPVTPATSLPALAGRCRSKSRPGEGLPAQGSRERMQARRGGSRHPSLRVTRDIETLFANGDPGFLPDRGAGRLPSNPEAAP